MLEMWAKREAQGVCIEKVVMGFATMEKNGIHC